MKKLLFFAIWILTIIFIPITVLKSTPIGLAFSQTSITINFLQRITGLLAFTLLFWQIILGAFMNKWIDMLGAWIFNFHVTQGAMIYALVILHPLLFVLFNFRALGRIDPFYVFTDLCVLCSSRLEFLYNFGRIGFWLITLGVVAAKFHTQPWLRVHWRKLHILNYVAIIVVAIHGRFMGSDTRPFLSWFYITTILIVSGIIIYSLFRLFRTH